MIAVASDCKTGKGLNQFVSAVRTALAKELERRKLRGMAGKTIRMMIVGIPNVGKSSLINKLAGAKHAKVEDRPGVTRGKQWVSLNNGMELLDMPACCGQSSKIFRWGNIWRLSVRLRTMFWM